MKNKTLPRRKFIQNNITLMAGLPLVTSTPVNLLFPDRKKVKLGLIGAGGRGRGLIGTFLGTGGAEFVAICDIDQKALDLGQKVLQDRKQTKAKEFLGEFAYKKLIEESGVDAVIIATPWDLHTPMSVFSMKAGVTTCCEVPIAYTLEECWELIETWEKTGTPCMQMENWSFRSDNLAILNMIRKGLMGSITHAHCAYSHDCIDHWYFEKGTGNTRWGAQFLIDHNRNQYPTHQQGPVLSWMDINNGDYYDTITSTASDQKSIHEYFKRHFPDHPNAKNKYKQGDQVTTVVKTKKGKTIVINIDMQSPRPYDNRWTVQGTQGIYNEQRDALYLTGVSPDYHAWEDFPPYHEKYEHEWAKSTFGGHGGADGTMANQIIKAISNKKALPLHLYDGVLMASIGPLSEMSIAGNSVQVKVPDFTRGTWETRREFFALDIG